MADCTELAQTLTDIAMNLGSRPGINTLEDVVVEMKKLIPGVSRDTVIDAIIESTEKQNRVTDDLLKKLNAIKQEARTDRRLTNKIAKLENTLKRGLALSSDKRKKRASQAIDQLRTIRDDLQKKLSKTIATQKQRRKKREPKTIADLRKKISELKGFIETGVVPPKAIKRGIGPTNLVKQLRDTRDELKKQLAQSEPAQTVRLEEQIAELERKIETGDILPTPKQKESKKSKQLEKLQFKRDELQREIRQRIQGLKPRSIFGRFIQEPFNVARGIMTSFDFSGVLRQGGFILVGRPVLASKALGPMFRAFASPRAQARIDKEIKSRPNFPLRRKAKSFHAPIDGTYKLSEREEIMQARFLDKIPGVAASNRAYTTFLNVLRADTFDVMVAGLSRDGDVTLDEAKAIANFVNVATGRGTLGKLENAAEGLNVAFFAPRYTASRFQLLLGQPFFGGNARTRKAIAKEYARYLIGMATVYALTALILDDDAFEWNSQSSDFGKVRIGKTRLDPLSGISQVTVLLSRVISGKLKSSTTGQINPIRGEDVGFGRTTTTGVIGSFLRYKLSPMFGTTLNLLSEEDPIGRPFGPEDLPKSLLIPLAMREVFETIQEQGLPRGTALSILAIFGMGIQTYGSTPRQALKDKLRRGESIDSDKNLSLFTNRELAKIRKEAKKSPFAESFNKLSFNGAMDAYAKASDDERSETNRLLRAKYRRQRKRLTDDQKQLYFELLKL